MESWGKNRTCRKSLEGGWELSGAGGGRRRLMGTSLAQGGRTRGPGFIKQERLKLDFSRRTSVKRE